MGKFDIRNADDLEKLLRRSCGVVTRAVSEEIELRLQAETKRNIYESRKPKIYRRTNEFLKSITSEMYMDDTGSYANVFFDPQKMHVDRGILNGKLMGALYGKHANNRGDDVRDKMVLYLEEGHSASKPFAYTTSNERKGTHQYPERKGAHMIQNTVSWMHDELPLHVIGILGRSVNNDISIVRKG